MPQGAERIPTMPQGAERIPTMPQGAERIPTMPQGAERIPTMPQGAERIPTMPQGAERIPTMPQGAERIPTMPQGAERIPTMPQNGGHIPTVPQGTGSASTVPQGTSAAPADNTRTPLVVGKVSFTGTHGGEFEIDGSDMISNDSGESQIYGCTMQGSDEKYVARILTAITPLDSVEVRRVRDKVLEFLDKVSRSESAHILPLIDHGTIKLGNCEKYVEIYPFCEGGDLGRRSGSIDYDTLCRDVIPAVNTALHKFHEAGFVHRDIKPDNLYYYKGSVVLGDFGITCDLREDGFATDRFKRGTLGYYAPELMSQAAIAASDYYSFGQTVWTLYSGEMMYRDLLRIYKSYGIEEQRNQINFAMMQNNYFGLDEIPEKQSFFEVLIRGLLQYDPTQRFGYEQVVRWLNGDKALANEVRGLDNGKTYSRAFTILGGECWDDNELAQTLGNNWEDALQLLYDGTLRDFIAMESFETATFIKNIVSQYAYTPDEDKQSYWQDAGLARLIMYLEKNKRLCWHGKTISRINDMAFLDMSSPYFNGLMRSRLICEWYQSQKPHSDSLLDALYEMTDMYCGDVIENTISLYWLMHFAQLGGDILFMGCKDLDTLIPVILESPSLVYGKSHGTTKPDVNIPPTPLVERIDLLGVLCMWGYSDAVRTLHDNWDKPYNERFEMFFEFLDNNTSGEAQARVRRFYHDYGPRSYLVWFSDNLDMYTITGAKCSALAEDIKASLPDSVSSVSRQFADLSELELKVAELMGYNESDIYMAQLGLSHTRRDESISSNVLGAMWYLDFLGQPAPLGFKNYLGI
ncbi:MAG: protein kinase, partial [Ruminococcus sp.]|nr:protein kinase [Ruminococcus sp.]